MVLSDIWYLETCRYLICELVIVRLLLNVGMPGKQASRSQDTLVGSLRTHVMRKVQNLNVQLECSNYSSRLWIVTVGFSSLNIVCIPTRALFT
jgi:hypothetical protein